MFLSFIKKNILKYKNVKTNVSLNKNNFFFENVNAQLVTTRIY